MKCPECQFENPDTQKFCGECGSKLEKVCPNCRSTNPAQYKFCGECGCKIVIPSEPSPKGLSFEEKLTKIQKYLPKGVAEKILAQKDKIEGEHKQVTVMFCDMEGFTQLSERLGPEEVYTIMDQVYEILIHKVHDYEGTVNEMTGDGIMALFGAPIALEDAPQRAIRSAMAIHREIAKFSDGIKKENKGIPALKMRVGIHSGPVVVGTLGNNLRVEFKAVGDTVNLASRMEGLAEPGATYVTGDTFKLTEGFFRFEALGEKGIKGKEEPIQVYRVIAPSSSRTRFDVSAERGLTPFVGRERDLELLLDGLDRVKGGKGQAFSIVSEAGIGKSRLLYELRKSVSSEDVTFLEGKCLSYNKSEAYHLIIDSLKANFDIREADGDTEITQKIKRGLQILNVDESTTLPYFLELFSVNDSGIDKIAMSPEARKDRIMETFKQIVLKGSELRPLIIAYEDLHWADKSSKDALKYILESIAGARVLMIFTYRPDFVHTWGSKSYHSQLNLNRLSNRESLQMFTYLLGTDDLEEGLEELILEKTEGIAFFIEEFIKSLKDLKIIERKGNKCLLTKDVQEVTVPSTIQDVIMARVDSLPEGAKEVLQSASVIEREFGYELLKKVVGLTEQALLSNLSILKDSELLYERGIYPQSAFIFKHALTREVVYDSILAKRKKKLHEGVGNSIVELFKENIDEHYGILARHYILGENYEKGAQYSGLAAEKAEKTASLNEAITYAKEMVVSLEKLPQTDAIQKKIIDARTVLGLYMLQMLYYVEAKEAVDPIIDLAQKSGYKSRLGQILTIVGTYNSLVEEDAPKALKHLGEAFESSEAVKDSASLALASHRLGVALYVNCEFKKALYYLEKAANIHEAANNLWGVSAIKSAISVFVYYLQGRINLGYQTSDEAIQMAEESGDIYSKSWAYLSHGICCGGKGFFEDATKYLLKGISFCEKINLLIWNVIARIFIGENYFRIGDYQNVKDHYEKAVQLGEPTGFLPSWINLYRIGIAKAKVMMNERDIDLESLYTYVKDNKIKIFEGWMRNYIGQILLNIDDRHMSDAEHWINKAIEANKRNGMMFHLGKDYALYAELFKRKKNQSKAEENKNKAINIFRECGADGWIETWEMS